MFVNRYCPNCGEAIQFDDARDFMFCSFCGGKVPNVGKQQNVVQQANNILTSQNENEPNLYISFDSSIPGISMVTRIVSTGEKNVYINGQTTSFKLKPGSQTVIFKIGLKNYSRDVVIHSDNSPVRIYASFDGRAQITIDQPAETNSTSVIVANRMQTNTHRGQLTQQNSQSGNTNQNNMNCPSCGAPINSFAAKCQYCGKELNHKVQATACQELCNRLDDIEASRPKESLVSLVSGFANKVMDTQKMTPTDQKKIELISNFLIPNNKAELMEFIFLAQARIQGCQDISKSSSDEYISFVQGELKNIWNAKLEQAFAKGRLVLANDNEFLSVERIYQMQKNQEKGLCRYCGGRFRGLRTKVCASCGKTKDY